MASPVTLFIVEGESRDLRFAEKMKDLFLKGRDDLRVICLPAAQNIYMLYERLAEEDFDLDVVEVLRETVPSAAKCLEGVERDSVDEVFLFFDYDSHQNNAPGCESDALVEAMLLAFDNEHESGKLYISYPMVEALYDYRAGQCQAHSGCFVDNSEIAQYKNKSGEGNVNVGKHMELPQWKDAIAAFVLRCKCLLGLDEVSFETYRELVTVDAIFREEKRMRIEDGRCLCYRLFQSFCSTISVISSLIPWLRCATLSSMIAPEEMDETQLISRVQVLLSKL